METTIRGFKRSKIMWWLLVKIISEILAAEWCKIYVMRGHELVEIKVANE